MKIYTKGGDTGETSLFGGKRIPKDDLRIQSYGTLDELNAQLGVALSLDESYPDVRSILLRIQGELFQLGAELATPTEKKTTVALIESSHIDTMEKEIDSMEQQLRPLRNFILPGGGQLSAKLHVARTIARRAEREIVSLNREEILRSEIIQYMNRLSDYFFVLARYTNFLAKIEDTLWIS